MTSESQIFLKPKMKLNVLKLKNKMVKIRKLVDEQTIHWIINGTKTVEALISQNTYRKGDIIIFYLTKGIEIEKQIKNVIHYDNIYDFIESNLEQTLPCVNNMNDAVNFYRKNFTAEEERKHGVTAVMF